MIEYKDIPKDLQDRLIAVTATDEFGTLNPETIYNGIRNSTGTCEKLAEFYDVDVNLVKDIKELNERYSKIQFILDLYENNPKYIIEILTTITNNENFSELTVEENLNTFSDNYLNSIVTQLENLQSKNK